MGNINRTNYHELNLLLWDIHSQFIDPRFAFEMYERRWGYVDKTKLLKKELKLIERLTRQFGNGLFMPVKN
jgi:hypothetical protein